MYSNLTWAICLGLHYWISLFNRHQQAAAYHQAGALRAGSPYSLPITSGSRFPPGGLLGHHPGLSPASSQGGGHHLPHIKQDLEAASSGNHHHGSSQRSEKECKILFCLSKKFEEKRLVFESKERNKCKEFSIFTKWWFLCFLPAKKKENHIKKPLNAFMLYMKEMRPVVQAECTLKESAAINQILGRRVGSFFVPFM